MSRTAVERGAFGCLMTEERLVRVSKFLSLVLRHRPDKVGLKLDGGGWVGVPELLRAVNASGFRLTPDELREVVGKNDKRRFALSEDGGRIRASQGHSVEVELGYEPRRPPGRLYHGTAERFLASIRETGLHRGARHHVHLSPDEATAARVGGRRGRAVVLAVEAGRMWADGFAFYLSENGVWLTERVPASYINFPS